MGYSTILDVIGAIIIAGAVTLMAIRANGSVSKMTYTYGSELTVQKNMTTVVRMIENDLRKIGYCAVPDNFTSKTWAIRSAGKNNITFLADLDFNGKIDTVKYYIGTKDDLKWTSNPRDFPLYRVINSGAPSPMNVGLTQFDFEFFNTFGDLLSFPIKTDSTSLATSATGIFSVRLTVLMESPFAYDELYAYSYWRQLRLSSRNLMDR